MRASVFAAALGLNTVGAAQTIANTIPTLLYNLLAGGALSAVFVPQLVRAMKAGDDAGTAYAHRLITLVVLVLGVLTIAATAAAPALASLYAGAGWSETDRALTTALTAWSLPQIFFYGLYTVLGQVLHARGRPAPLMWAPALNNVIAGAVGVLFIVYATVDTSANPQAAASLSPGEIAFLGVGVSAGVVAQALILLPALRRAGFAYRPRFDFAGSGLGRSARLAGWSVLFVVANQVAFTITAVVANTAGKAAQGAVPWAAGLPSYTNAYMIMLVPHGLIAVSLAAALLPHMSSAAVDGHAGDVAAEVARGLELAGRLLVPIAVAVLTLGPAITRLVFFANPPADTHYMGLVLAAFAPAIVVFSAQFLVIRGLHALEDTRTPFLIQLVVTGVQVATVLASAALLPPAWVVVGAAAGFSLAYTAGLVLSLTALRRTTGARAGRRVLLRYLRWLAAATAAALATHLATRLLAAPAGPTPAGAALTLIAGAATFLATFAGLCAVIRPPANPHDVQG